MTRDEAKTFFAKFDIEFGGWREEVISFDKLNEIVDAAKKEFGDWSESVIMDCFDPIGDAKDQDDNALEWEFNICFPFDIVDFLKASEVWKAGEDKAAS